MSVLFKKTKKKTSKSTSLDFGQRSIRNSCKITTDLSGNIANDESRIQNVTMKKLIPTAGGAVSDYCISFCYSSTRNTVVFTCYSENPVIATVTMDKT